MAFTPSKKNSFKDKFKNYLLKGYVIRYDCIGDHPLEVFPREFKDELSRMGNIGNHKGFVELIHCSHSNLHEAVEELEKEYSVTKISCAYSGCCQHSTYGYYLDGE